MFAFCETGGCGFRILETNMPTASVETLSPMVILGAVRWERPDTGSSLRTPALHLTARRIVTADSWRTGGMSLG